MRRHKLWAGSLSPAITAAFLMTGGSDPARAVDPTVGYPFTVQVTTTPKAQARLKAINEKINVVAFYAGHPVPAKAKLAVEGEIDIGDREDIRLPFNGGAASFKAELSKPKLSWVTEPRLLINVYTARTAHPDNLLDCGIFDGTMADARKQPIRIACKLIGEN